MSTPPHPVYLPDQSSASMRINDIVAMGALQALANNAKIPGADFAIVGFDDVPEGAHSRPSQRCRAKSEKLPPNSFWCEWHVRIKSHASLSFDRN